MAAALALLAQLFAWAWAPAMGVAAAGADGVAVICTAEGFKSVVLDESGSAKSERPPFDTSNGHCPLCPLVHGLGMTPVEWAMSPPVVKAHEAAALPGDQIAAGWFLATLQARGPPLQG